MGLFSKLLVANRGEIAVRVLRTARAMGYRTVAVYSEADREAPHVALADEAVLIGASAATASYLQGESILEAARRTGSDAIHPGYGFLSENAAFAASVEAAGLVFVGPPSEAIRAMGDKARAKARMAAAGVPVAPGYAGEDQTQDRFQAEAERVGYPLLVKAVAGGGGRGIRVVASADELPAALESARREAQSAFGDGTLMLERRIQGGRHVEVQVFADAHGQVLHLGERDCTAQRRRQKVIEESPSPILTPAQRTQMGAAAVAAARAVGYRGAGTIEFMVDESGRFYFLEMNTRLQVEHPVTELVTGLDLVRWQLLVADGGRLPAAADEIVRRGHAIEARLYAEDPYSDFRPQTGEITRFDAHAATAWPGVRIDSGVAAGGAVTPFYDPMVAKVIALGSDRAEATRRLVRALEAAPLFGLRSNARFLIDLLEHPEFQAAHMTTTRLDEWAERGEPILTRPTPPREAWLLAAALLGGDEGFRSGTHAGFDLVIEHEGARKQVRVEHGAAGTQVELDGARTTIQVLERGTELRWRVEGVERRAPAHLEAGRVSIAIRGHVFLFSEPPILTRRAAAEDPRQVRAPLAGVVARVAVAVGERVAAGATLAVIEAMKMETRVVARSGGVVRTASVAAGAQVEAGRVLFELELDPEA